MSKLQSESFQMTEEPRVKFGNETLKPDLILVQGEQAKIVDAQVIGKYKPLNSLNAEKVRKYSRPTFIEAVKRDFSVRRVGIYALTATESGIVCPKSAALLVSVGLSCRDEACLWQEVDSATTIILCGGRSEHDGAPPSPMCCVLLT